MADNILKKHGERTVKELVAEVYPADRPYRDLLNEAIKAVKKVVGGNGWFAVDRGMDSVEFVFFMKRRDFLGVVRMNKMDRDARGWGTRARERMIGRGRLEGPERPNEVK